MSAERLSMRQVREVLRLTQEVKLSRNAVARALCMSRSAVTEIRKRAARAGLCWPLAEEWDDARLEAHLFPKQPGQREYAPMDFEGMLLELKRPGVTLHLLWEEYQGGHPGGAYQYSQYCQYFRDWQDTLRVTMRQIHKAGEKMFVDYAGPTVEVIDGRTGEVRQAQIFVAVLGASNYTYAEATWTQEMRNWIGSHERAYGYFGGVAAVTVPDNLKSGVKDAHRYEPVISAAYWAMAKHYGTTVIPARPRKPRDKSKVEAGVLAVERLVARLRHRQFFSLDELNTAIKGLLEVFNNKPFQKLSGSRRSQYETLDKPALKPLPAMPFEFFELSKERVGFNYHVTLEKHYYSVPYTLARKQVEARVTARSVEFLYQGRRVAIHARSFNRSDRYTTLTEHMPEEHRAQEIWNPERFLNWGKDIGPATMRVVREILARPIHVEQAYKSSLGLLNLSKRYGRLRLEAASVRAVHFRTFSCRSVETILKHGFESQPLPVLSSEAQEELFTQHVNVRGSGYYAA